MKDNRFYVYQILDPRTNKILYIGKGTGGRCYTHFTINRINKNADENDLFYVLEEILDTTTYSQFDCVNIIKSKISDKDAKILELKIIKEIGYENLYNKKCAAKWMNGSKWMNNGIIDKQFLLDEEIPINFKYHGRLKNPKWAGKNKGRKWITNGKENKMVYDISNLEHGWTLGKTTFRRYLPAWNKGLTKETDFRIEKGASKLRKQK